ncbi:MAG: GIY-YIG nuclease family protein [Paludibacteraceae bacterium]|nr:GIY-YIG nuclease family protein [Paludibacteraceae bacterium]
MKQYCIDDFLDSSFGVLPFLKQRTMSHIYVQMQDCAKSTVMRSGEEVGKILIFDTAVDKEYKQEIPIIAPVDGYYFIDPNYVLYRVKNIDIKKCFIKCYEDYGDDIDDGEDHFENCYNELLTAIRDYYDDFIFAIELKKEYAYLGKCDYSYGMPATDQPADFLSLVDVLLKRKPYLSKENIIQKFQASTFFVQDVRSYYYTPVMVFLASKSIIIFNKLLKFKDIAKLDKSDAILNHNNKTIAYANNIIIKSIVQKIIKANKNEDYSNICSEECLKKYKQSYTLLDLMRDEDRELIEAGVWNIKFVDELDVAFPDDYIDSKGVRTRYYIAGDVIFELCGYREKKIQIRAKESGYYSFVVPMCFDATFIGIPFITYTSKEKYCESSKDVYEALCPSKFTIDQDRFSKGRTLKWSSMDNVQILPDEWYEFRVSFNYVKNIPTITFGFKNGYSKQIINRTYKYIDGKEYNIYLLLESGESYEYNKRNYRETYIGKNNYYIWVEYLLGKQEINSFLHNAIEAVRICTPEGEIFEYEAEPFFYHIFKKYVKIYYDAIVMCDSSLKCDIGDSAKAIEPCSVYLMHDLANGYYKIGISNNPEYRERTLQSEKPTIELVIAKEFPVRRIAEAFEAALHKTYESKRLRGEWFRLGSNDVEDLKKALS